MSVIMLESKKEYAVAVDLDESVGGGTLNARLVGNDGLPALLEVLLDKDDEAGKSLMKNQPVVYAYLGGDIEAAVPKAEAIVDAVVAGWSMV